MTMRRIVAIFFSGVLGVVAARADVCDAGQYRNGETCMPCPAAYPHSVPNADSINDCYLVTDVGNYVAHAGAPQTPCPENYYCPGGGPVAYDMRNRFYPIQYIKSTGTQYINTGIILGSYIDTEMVFEPAGVVKGDNALFGVRASAENVFYTLNGYNNMVYIRYNDYHPQNETRGALKINVKQTLEIRHGDWILDGKTIYSNSGVFDTGAPGYLFATLDKDTGAAKWLHQSLKVYSFTQWRDGEKVIDLIPVYDSVHDVCGMLDLVTGNFLGNIGTEKFECGAPLGVDVWASDATSCAVATDNVAPYSPVGSDDVLDCGLVLHFSDDYILYLRTVARTEHSLKLQVGGNIFYGDITEQKCGHLRIHYHGQVMSVCNMDVDI